MYTRWKMPTLLNDTSSDPFFFLPSHSTRTLREMVRDLSNANFSGGGLRESQSYSSTLANPPASPDYSRDGSPVPSDNATGQLTTDISNLSLSVNYLPSKFSSGVLSGAGEVRKRPLTQDSADFLGVPKMGGGIDVFKNGEARMGGEGDGDEDGDEDDGSVKKWFVRGRRGDPHMFNKKLRWNKFKWILFIANTIVSFLSLFWIHVDRWFLVDHLLIDRTYILSLDLVRRLGSSRHYPRW